MTQQYALSLNEVVPFSALSEENLNILASKGKVFRYSIGQRISDGDIIPNQITIVLEGQARLCGVEDGKPVSVGKLGKGSVIGLASLLRAGGCEQVSAASELIGFGIPDSSILELYKECATFRRECDKLSFPAELYAIASHLVRLSPKSRLNAQEALSEMLRSAETFTSDESVTDLSDDYIVLASSQNIPGITAGDIVNIREGLPKSRPPLSGRFIKVPRNLIESIMTPIENIHTQTLTSTPGKDANTEDITLKAPRLPGSSNAELGQYEERVRFKLVKAQGELQETLACMQMLASELDVPFRRDNIEKIVRDVFRREIKPSLQLFGGLASMMGLHATHIVVPQGMAGRLQTPAIIPWEGGFALLRRSNSEGATLASPKQGMIEIGLNDLIESFPDGIQMLLADKSSSTPQQKFGVEWFFPVIKRYSGVLTQVLIASFVVQLFGLANPLLIQVIIDKVISQRSLDTLQILGLALVVVTVLEGVLGSLRTFLFTETTNRIDLRLGSEVIDHLLRLPLGYFDRRPVGELSSRIAELEKIREFLTGQGLTVILDAAFSVIYIVVMVMYSWVLTLVALAVLPVQIGLTLLGAPLYRRQTREVAQNNARTQSHLVEVLGGIQTVKAQNVEMVSRWKWQDLYSQYIGRTFEKSLTATTLSQSGQILQKLSQLLVLWVGASLVLGGEMSLGQLIAFRIISSYVTQPLLRLSNIWQNIQELKVSFERLSDVIDTPQESDEKDRANIPLPSITGRVTFDNVDFRFSPNGPLVLQNIALDIPPGTFVGVVGQSGSGKSTLMKLLPRLYAPEKGRILVDGYEINKVELYSLRRQIGIVPQDPLLFSGSISENISITDPEARSEEVVAAAKIACAHDFIMSLPNGYSSDVGERGTSLSGGQRQRVAIARTLLSNPKLLVMDEATSALDYDTERRVCENLRESLNGCTVFFITHRLSTIRNADVILMMDKGTIVEQGKHEDLMARRGRYFALYRQQETV